MKKKRKALRSDTTVAPAGEPENEIYVWSLPACCLRSLKEAAVAKPVEPGERRLLALECSCGRSWWVTSSLDERVLGRFVMHGGPRVGGSGHRPPAA